MGTDFDFAVTVTGKLVTPRGGVAVEVVSVARAGGGYALEYGGPVDEAVARYVSAPALAGFVGPKAAAEEAAGEADGAAAGEAAGEADGAAAALGPAVGKPAGKRKGK